MKYPRLSEGQDKRRKLSLKDIKDIQRLFGCAAGLLCSEKLKGDCAAMNKKERKKANLCFRQWKRKFHLAAYGVKIYEIIWRYSPVDAARRQAMNRKLARRYFGLRSKKHARRFLEVTT